MNNKSTPTAPGAKKYGQVRITHKLGREGSIYGRKLQTRKAEQSQIVHKKDFNTYSCVKILYGACICTKNFGDCQPWQAACRLLCLARSSRSIVYNHRIVRLSCCWFGWVLWLEAVLVSRPAQLRGNSNGESVDFPAVCCNRLPFFSFHMTKPLASASPVTSCVHPIFPCIRSVVCSNSAWGHHQRSSAGDQHHARLDINYLGEYRSRKHWTASIEKHFQTPTLTLDSSCSWSRRLVLPG